MQNSNILFKEQINAVNRNREDGIKAKDGVKTEDVVKIEIDEIMMAINILRKFFKNRLVDGDLNLTNFDNRTDLSGIVNKYLGGKKHWRR